MKAPTIEQHIKIWLAIVLTGGAILGYLRFIDGTIVRPVTDIAKREVFYQTTQAVYKPGDTITIKSPGYCKHRSTPVTRDFVLEDHVLLPFLTQTTNFPPGCIAEGKEVWLTELGSFVPENEYRIRGTMCYQANPLRKVCYEIQTNTFKVIK